MPTVPRITKGAFASFPHVFDYRGWSQLQGESPDTISSATATVSPSGLTLGTPGVNDDGNQVSVQISDGTEGVTYRITTLATTSAGDVLDAYADVFIGTGIEGAVLYPSQFGPYLDTNRAMSLLIDESDLDDDESTPSWVTVDGNERAFFLAQTAWRTILQACRRGNIYGLQELTDYANDVVRGADLIELAADLFWCRLIGRRRYTQGEPQGKDPACENAEAKLGQLRRGERIFDLTGVTNSDGGTYGNEVGDATRLTVGTFGSTDRTGRDRRLWGCTDDDSNAWRRQQGPFGPGSCG